MSTLVTFWAPAEAVESRAVQATLPWKLVPLLEEEPPLERRIRTISLDALRSLRRSLKRSMYMVTNSPNWWGRRAKRMFWPVIFAIAALFFDTALIAAWKNDGARVLVTYVPMMMYVYSRLFVSRGASVVTRLGVVVALVYGVWRHDLIVDGRWSSISFGRLDDLVLIALAVRAFIVTCPEELVGYYAERAIAIRNRINPTASSPG